MAPGARSPSNGETVTTYHYAVAKRQFLRPEFIQWLAPVIDALADRISSDLKAACVEIGSTYLSPEEIVELDKTHEDFTWSIPKEPNQAMQRTAPRSDA